MIKLTSIERPPKRLLKKKRSRLYIVSTEFLPKDRLTKTISRCRNRNAENSQNVKTAG